VAPSQILVIDDDSSTASMIAALFPEEMCSVSVAESCNEGVAAAQNNVPMLVLLNADIERGYSCCRRFKKDSTLRQLPLILLSAEASDEQFAEHQSLASRADAYLKKPLDEALLASTIIELIGSNAAPSLRTARDETIVDVMDDLPDGFDTLVVDVLLDEEDDSEEAAPVVSSEPAEPQEHVPVLEEVADAVAELYAEPDKAAPQTAGSTALDEKESLIEQLADLRMAYQRAEQVYEIERSRLEEQIEALKKRCAHLETLASDGELNSLRERTEEQDLQIDALRAELRRLREQRNDFNATIETLISQNRSNEDEPNQGANE
jgi:DNA-binding response OmpR family regulator